jgi:hypothetical protein
MSYIHVEENPGDVMVWIYTEKGAPMFTHAIVIGGGESVVGALAVAAADLRHALEQVNALARKAIAAPSTGDRP